MGFGRLYFRFTIRLSTVTNMADTSAAKNQKAKIAEDEAKQRAIDRKTAGSTSNENEVPAPLDYSFLNLTTIEDAEREEPRLPVLGKMVSPRGSGKFAGRCLRLNNNPLSEIKGLKIFVETMFVNPHTIGWIDLSFNVLQSIDVILTEFPNLEILYLHGNNITSLKEVDKLMPLTKLRKLTLHGNDVDKEKGYRMYVLSTLPMLRNFDFSAVTKCERKTAETWRLLNSSNKKKKKIEAED